MSTVAPVQNTQGTNGLVNILGAEEQIRVRLEEARKRLEQEAGMERKEIHHFHRPIELPFTALQRDQTTILFGGLTWKHERLVHAALESLGYRCESVPVPNKKAFQLGKEYGNNGQCNPTYFTVGNLVQYVQDLESKGLTKDEICNRYVFFTAGACGPCRFGMYESEYRIALRNAGFDKFRVLLFQQSGGLNQAEAEAGLEMNVDFFLAILNALNIGDVINDLAYQIRPYEINAGETDRVLEQSMEILHEAMRRRQPWLLEGTRAEFLKKTRFGGTAEYIGKFVHQLFGDDLMAALRQVRDLFAAVPIDRTRVKPIVKITGEFWAQTTEGDGNFNMFRFLEKEGAQVVVEPIGTWICYLMHQVVQKYHDQKGLEEGAAPPPSWRLDKRVKINLRMRKKIAQIKMAEGIFKREYNRIIEALGGIGHHLVDQYELQRLGHPYYNSRAAGGEGHLEVAKNIYYSHKGLAHMVLALKPFGCMPSTQSDGAQSAVMSHYKDMIFLPVETSGEGDVNAHSRVQMALGEAKAKTKLEFKAAIESTGRSVEEIRAYASEHPELQSPMYHVPHIDGVTGTAASFVRHVGALMNAENKPVQQRASVAA